LNRSLEQISEPFNGLSIQSLTEDEASGILSWRYPAPFDYYDPPGAGGEELISELLDPLNGFFGIRDAQRGFVGFCSFGRDGQVLGGKYDGHALDIGLGMKPDLISQGNGTAFFHAIVLFATQTLAANSLRLTVADFNTRAIRIYERLGFEVMEQFHEPVYGVSHSIMVRR
jgi:ribosomal-protein-alanine N-acetyltransferase